MKKDMDSSVFGGEAKDTGQPSVARFTPGPWDQRWDYKQVSRDGKFVIAHACGPQHVCRGEAPFPDAPNILQPPAATMELVYADARLIAAAPDLYAALVVVLQVWEEGTRGTTPFPAEQIRAALHKAAPQTVAENPAPLPNTDKSNNNTGGTSDGGRDGTAR